MYRSVKLQMAFAAVTAILLTFAATAMAQKEEGKGRKKAASDAPEASRGGWRDACRADLAQYCSGAQGQGGRAKRQCLDTNLTKLSAACQASLTERRQQRAEARQACRTDLQKLCKEITTGGSAQIACLRQKLAEVSPDCSKALAVVTPGLSTSEPSSSKSAPAPKN